MRCPKGSTAPHNSPAPIRMAGQPVGNRGHRVRRGTGRGGTGVDTQNRPLHVPAGVRPSPAGMPVMVCQVHRPGREVLGVLSVAGVGLSGQHLRQRGRGELPRGDTGVMQLFSQPANGRSARDIVQATLRKRYPDAKVAYEIPNAMVGYEPGYGVLADDWPQNPAASYTRQRILVMASVKDDLALTAFAAGPYRAFGPDSGPGLPSGANLEIAQDLGKYVNSFQWGSGMG